MRGEFCLIVDGSAEEEEIELSWWVDLSIEEHVEHHIESGLPSKEAIRKTATERGIAKRDVYQAYHVNP